MNIKIHRGTKEIGGSCIELQAENTRILLDFGIPLVDENKSEFNFKDYKTLSIPELIEKGILPNIQGLYSEEENTVDAIFITHAHLDHYGFLQYVNKNIPVYLSKGTKELIEITKYFGGYTDNIEQYKIISAWESVKIKDISIIPYLVDHSAFDAFAYLIEAEGKRIFYTGDFRAHGRKKVLFENIINKPPKNIDYLLMEGSMIGRNNHKNKSEEELEVDLKDLLSVEDKLMFITCSSQNIDRLVSVYKACYKSNRILVIDPYTAYVLERLGKQSVLPQYDWNKYIRVFFAQSSRTSKLFEDRIAYKYASAKISIDEIIENNEKVLIKDNYYIRNKLDKKDILKDKTMIWSLWDGYLKEQQEFFDDRNVKIIHAHVSGHAYVDDLKTFVEALNPKNIIPIHTFNPKEYKKLFGNNIIELSDGISETL